MGFSLAFRIDGGRGYGRDGGIGRPEDPLSQAGAKKENTTQRLKRERESEVWGKLIDQVGQPNEGVEFVHVMDRGADNFEIYCHCLEQKVDWVVRVTQKQRNIITSDGRRTPLKRNLKSLPLAGTYQLELRARPKQPPRTAKLEVRFGALRVPPPVHKSPYLKRLKPEAILMSVVHVREVDAPKGVEPIEWVLLTSLTVDDFDDAWVIVEYYETRWLIEEWHKALKNGLSRDCPPTQDERTIGGDGRLDERGQCTAIAAEVGCSQRSRSPGSKIDPFTLDCDAAGRAEEP